MAHKAGTTPDSSTLNTGPGGTARAKYQSGEPRPAQAKVTDGSGITVIRPNGFPVHSRPDEGGGGNPQRVAKNNLRKDDPEPKNGGE